MNPVELEKDYRPDIDGLRAIAIISVILFHLDNNYLPGGFTGVDIFFVISGFLISTHIINDININGAFSYKRFYLKRIKRIIPALVVMMLMTIFFGYLIFTPYYFQYLSEQVLSATLMVPNFWFYSKSGYFDVDSIFKPLLHTWSLGVEEQFYLVWPIVLLITVRSLRYGALLWVIPLIGIASFLLNDVYLNNKAALFYMMPFRVFEFSGGATLAYLTLSQRIKSNNSANQILSLIGLILLIWPMFFLNENSIFPFYNALPSTIGAMLIIYTKNGVVNRALSIRPSVVIGLISYSLYLYHWPIIVFYKYLHAGSLTIKDEIFIVALTILFSTASYLFVEKYFRFSAQPQRLKILLVIVGATIIISTPIQSGVVLPYGGQTILSVTEYKQAQSNRFILTNNKDYCDFNKLENENCDLEAETQVLFIGNSHAIDGYNTFYGFLHNNDNINLINFGNISLCDFYMDNNTVVSRENKCPIRNQRLNSPDFLSKLDVVVVDYFKFQEWGGSFANALNHIREINPELKIVVLGSYIGVRPNECFDLINKTGSFSACKEQTYVSYWGDNDRDWIYSQNFANSDFLYIDRIALLCGESKVLKNCITHVGKNLIFYDGDHFSIEGSEYVGEKVFNTYGSELGRFGFTVAPIGHMGSSKNEDSTL